MMSYFQSRVIGKIALVATLLFSVATEARQFRQITPIPVAPEKLESTNVSAAQSSSLLSVETLNPVDEQAVRDALQKIVRQWNTQGLDDYLDDYFPQRNELLLTLSRDIPSDATLELISVQNISTISQVWGNVTPPLRSQISTVIATVSLQLRFNDPVVGLVTLPHTSQFYLRVVETE